MSSIIPHQLWVGITCGATKKSTKGINLQKQQEYDYTRDKNPTMSSKKSYHFSQFEHLMAVYHLFHSTPTARKSQFSIAI